jgi:hypothetical protein
MAVKLAYQGEVQYANTKGIILKATLVGSYGAAANGVGDLMNLNPTQNNGVDGGVTDPLGAYNLIISDVPPSEYGPLNENIGGSYVNIKPNAVPTLANFGLQVYEPGGTEKANGAAYTATELAGSILLIFFVSGNQ